MPPQHYYDNMQQNDNDPLSTERQLILIHKTAKVTGGSSMQVVVVVTGTTKFITHIKDSYTHFTQ